MWSTAGHARLAHAFHDRPMRRHAFEQALRAGGGEPTVPCGGGHETAPYLPIEDKQCCHGKVSIPADLLDAYQDIPFGTPAWKRSYGRRNPIEKTISMIKDKGGLKPGWCRSFGLAAHTIGVLALAIAHNLKQTLKVEKTRPAKPKSHQPTRRNITADALIPKAPPG